MLDYTKVESRLKSFLKNNKKLGYSVALLVSFLINGGFSYAVETRAELRDKIVQEQDNVSQMLKDADKSISNIELKIKKLTQRGEFWVKPLERSYQVAFITSFGNYTKNRNRTDQNFTEPEYNVPATNGQSGNSGNRYVVDINGITVLANNKATTGNSSSYRGSYNYNGRNLGEYGIVKNPLEFVDKIDFGANITPKAVAEKTVAVKTVSETKVTEPKVSVSKIDVSRVTVTPPAAPVISAPANPGNPSVNVTAPGAITPLGTITVAAIPAINVSVATPTVGAAPVVNAPTVATPPTPAGFTPKLITPPVAPAEPATPVISIPTLVVKVASNGNGTSNVIDGNGNNGTIEMVAITSGDFKVSRDGWDGWNYSYSGYSGRNSWAIGPATTTNPSGSSVAANGTWSNWSRTSTSNSGNKGFMSVIGSTTHATMWNNGSFIYSRALENASSNLGELVHLDVHGIAPYSTQRQGLVDSGASQAVLDMFDEVHNTQLTTEQASVAGSSYDGNAMHSWVNSGNIVIEGGNTSLTNTYSHGGYRSVPGIETSMNAGTIIFQPYKTGGNVYQKYTAAFVVSNDVSYRDHNVKYNGATGIIRNYTQSGVIFVSDASSPKPFSLVNRGELQLFGEGSAGIYIKRAAKTNLHFVTKDFALDPSDTTNNTVATGSYKPIEIFGDKSIGLYNFTNDTNDVNNSTEGHFAVNIGAAGKGNQKFTTEAGKTSGDVLTNHDINPSSTNQNIEGSFGILSNTDINLTSHKIKIFDKTEGNVGVYPNADKATAHLKIGGGSIEIDGGGAGSTSKNNIGIYINEKGAVTSSGDVKVSGGVGNLAVFAIGSATALPSGATAHVTVRKIEGTNTKNSVLVYGKAGAKIVATGGLTMTGATVEADATVANKKDTGAVFSSGSGTVVTINRAALPSSENISITGTEQVDAKNAGTGKYVGFGLMAKDGGKINAQYNNISVTNGSTGIASIGKDGSNVASEIDLSHSKLSYNGKGYAVYTDGTGKVNLDDTEINLRGSSTAFDVDLAAATLPTHINSGTKIKIHSDDVIVFNVKNATGLTTVGGIETSIKSKIETKLGLAAGALSGLFTGSTATKYKTAAADGGSLVVGSLDKSGII